MRHGRRNFDERKKIHSIVARAVQLSKQPGDITYGTTPSAPGGSSIISPSLIGISTMPDEDGNTLHQFTFDIDAFDDPKARFF